MCGWEARQGAEGVPWRMEGHSARLWRAVPGPRAGHEQADELLPSLSCPKQARASQRAGCRGSPEAPELTMILASAQ